ncbi:serine/threonine protein phosphatase [Amylibacter ulvae]|uniref:Serine/threonine protein phosphatase n=1 Tax=Paramylibacter ulvae TaxID=1651968 RepID=A0ABQ3D3M9_9RHOB|nr:metallophosphoesterase [Amylibacter ulvae]GHA57107.1 serine/threonine protein phosphatase [Amylibacter ulvae]
MNNLIYAIGDIHGDLTQLIGILKRIEMDASGADHTVVFIGDLIDRREDSKGVIDHIMNGQNAGKPWVVLKGNHDRYLQWFMEDPHRIDTRLRSDYFWMHPRMGGAETLESYGINLPENPNDHLDAVFELAKKHVPASHYEFLKSQRLYYETDDYFFVHAGVNNKRPLHDQVEDDLLWIRPGFLDQTEPFEKLIIHGHTVIDEVTHYGNRINIDTGAAWGKTLSALVIDNGVFSNLTATGRVELIPRPELIEPAA